MIYFPTFAQDVVAVLNSSFTQVFANARPLKASIKESAKAMEHPVEKGGVITDFRIIEPITIELPMIVSSADYKDVYSQIKSLFLSSELLVVQTFTGRYPSMMIQSMPHEEDPALFQNITVALSLKQVIIVEAQYGKLPPSKVKKAANSTTVDGGEKSPEEAKSSYALQAGKSIANFFKGK